MIPSSNHGVSIVLHRVHSLSCSVNFVASFEHESDIILVATYVRPRYLELKSTIQKAIALCETFEDTESFEESLSSPVQGSCS